MGKLDNTQKAAIYQSWKDGTSPKELAKQYHISLQAVYQLINKLNRASAEICTENDRKPCRGSRVSR